MQFNTNSQLSAVNVNTPAETTIDWWKKTWIDGAQETSIDWWKKTW